MRRRRLGCPRKDVPCLNLWIPANRSVEVRTGCDIQVARRKLRNRRYKCEWCSLCVVGRVVLGRHAVLYRPGRVAAIAGPRCWRSSTFLLLLTGRCISYLHKSVVVARWQSCNASCTSSSDACRVKISFFRLVDLTVMHGYLSS